MRETRANRLAPVLPSESNADNERRPRALTRGAPVPAQRAKWRELTKVAGSAVTNRGAFEAGPSRHASERSTAAVPSRTPNVELTGVRQQGSPADGRSIDQLRLAAGLPCCCASG